MKEVDEKTIEEFAKRSNRTVMGVTLGFAMVGALLDIGAHMVSSIFMNGAGVSMLWGMWIPLCFVTIPPIHYLCRHAQNLQERINKLETILEKQAQ
ncbi:MAG: hypothetical protein R3C01_10040 [Planctomycetaceae bacterium]